MDKLTVDLFLNGQVKAYQDSKGYKSGTDAVLLASLINKHKDNSFLEIGCGVGVTSLCLAYRLDNINIIGIEKNKYFYDLACKNTQLNNFINSKFTPVLGNILDYKFKQQFEVIFTNPPYFQNLTNKNSFSLKEYGNMETDAKLQDFINFAFINLKNHGYYYIIQRSERLQEVIQTLISKHWGNIEIFPIYSYIDKPASRIIIKAKKIGANISKIHHGIIMHNQDKSYTNRAINILKYGKAFFDEFN